MAQEAKVFKYQTPQFDGVKKTLQVCNSDLMKVQVQVVKDGGENNLHSHTGDDAFWYGGNMWSGKKNGLVSTPARSSSRMSSSRPIRAVGCSTADDIQNTARAHSSSGCIFRSVRLDSCSA